VSQWADVVETRTTNSDGDSSYDGLNFSESGEVTVRHKATLRPEDDPMTACC
jgi:hypothetical protein